MNRRTFFTLFALPAISCRAQKEIDLDRFHDVVYPLDGSKVSPSSDAIDERLIACRSIDHEWKDIDVTLRLETKVVERTAIAVTDPNDKDGVASVWKDTESNWRRVQVCTRCGILRVKEKK